VPPEWPEATYPRCTFKSSTAAVEQDRLFALSPYHTRIFFSTNLNREQVGCVFTRFGNYFPESGKARRFSGVKHVVTAEKFSYARLNVPPNQTESAINGV
jgi:hypothetical protein